ncbi:hypothetical protein C2G38_2030098 [Gigaspora rosea]|uniref:Uncharacterized protein n=1 Tax=Gigaspora rosea TaxID=44941 RepID=A0A397VXB0_9GLOM|nr:hypothetical protein C2G38_2030098 [Gigaspora rosea]
MPMFDIPKITFPEAEKIEPTSSTTDHIEKGKEKQSFDVPHHIFTPPIAKMTQDLFDLIIDQPEFPVASSSESTDISLPPEIIHVEPVDDKSEPSPKIIESVNDEPETNNEEASTQLKTYPPGYIPREEREKRLRQWAIDHNKDPDKFVTITDKNKTDSIDYLTRIDVDANICLFNIEQGNDPHDFMEMMHWERLIGEEILCRRLEDAGECIWLDTDKKWIK